MDTRSACAMDISDREPVAHPLNSRVSINGLASRADLNGKEARIVEWIAEKQRFAVEVMGHKPLLVRPANLTRCPDAFASLDMDSLRIMMGSLATWNDAARAMMVQKAWRKALLTGAWPRFAVSTTPQHWKQRKRFGTEWVERGPFARPLNWTSPCPEPSWIHALEDLPGFERVPQLLEWIDRFDLKWPGVATTRWPGAARRLAWARGAPDQILKHELRGCVLREWPEDSGNISPHSYRDGGQYDDSMAVAAPCRFALPADAALFMALLPSGFGELASDGSFVRPFDGFEIKIWPWETHTPPGAVAARDDEVSDTGKCGADLEWIMDHRQHGCDPDMLLPLARPRHDLEASSQFPSSQHFLLCCDKSSDHFGKILVVDFCKIWGILADGSAAPSYRWTEAHLTDLLTIISQAADEAVRVAKGSLDKCTNGERAAACGRGKWDLAWRLEFQTRDNVVSLLVAQFAAKEGDRSMGRHLRQMFEEMTLGGMSI